MRADPRDLEGGIERLVAYADDELDAAARADVEKLIGDDPEARELVEALRSHRTRLKDTYSAVLEEPRPTRLLDRIATFDFASRQAPVVPPQPRTDPPVLPIGEPQAGTAPVRRGRPMLRRLTRIAASLVLLATATAGGYLAGRLQTDTAPVTILSPLFAGNWLDDIAAYHKLYANEKRHRVEVGAEETPHIEAWLGKRLNRPLVVPNLTNDGVAFEGARLLQIEGRPVAQLMYQDPQGRPLALCITPTARTDSPLANGVHEGLNTVDWRHQGYAYVLVGWADVAVLEDLAVRSIPLLDL